MFLAKVLLQIISISGFIGELGKMKKGNNFKTTDNR